MLTAHDHGYTLSGMLFEPKDENASVAGFHAEKIQNQQTGSPNTDADRCQGQTGRTPLIHHHAGRADRSGYPRYPQGTGTGKALFRAHLHGRGQEEPP